MSHFALRLRSHRHTFPALAALGVLTAAAWLAAPAVATAAQPAANGLQTNVYYDSRDLATERGTRALYRRILNAAQDVCPGNDSSDASVVAASKACQRVAVARAIGQIGNTQLAALDAQEVANGTAAG